MPSGKYYGITGEDENRKFKEITEIAKSKVAMKEMDVSALKDELHELSEVYDIDEKEGLAQWFQKDNRFQEVRKELMRAKRALKKPYFGRIDFVDPAVDRKETYYIGKTGIYKDPVRPEVIDWRSPVASVYYDQSLGKCRYIVPEEGASEILLERKRTYEIDDNGVKDFFDSEVVANDDLLTKYLSKSTKNVLGEIIATIQKEQNDVIRINPHHNVLIQGSAGSGKTTVAMHRISYILYNYEKEFDPKDFYIVGSNKMLLNYITGVLPDLDVYDVKQLTMDELFIRLLYEQWDPKLHKAKAIDKTDKRIGAKGTSARFAAISEFCDELLAETYCKEDIVIEETGRTIMTKADISKVLTDRKGCSAYQIVERLTDVLIGKLENELFGKGLSYSQELQRKLYTRYNFYFSRVKIKRTVFDIYDEFVQKEAVKNPEILETYEKFNPDIYDLAALSFIYKKVLETEVIREACHVVIDEAQDFGIFIYRSLKYCLSKGTFTIMGDVSQNINLGCGLSDWEELKKVMLPEPYDYFGLLRKSYRNTIEISDFATLVLKHGTFPIYPVEPIVRHGNKVETVEKKDYESLTESIVKEASRLCREYDTIALICKDNAETDKMYKAICDKNPQFYVNRFNEENMEIKSGLTVLPIEYSKGLEFDAVIICNASEDNYPKEDGYVKLLYVAATRALHELKVFYIGKLTGLIKDPISKEREENFLIKDDFHKKAYVFEEDLRTKSEKAVEQSKLGMDEMALRDKYGPRRNIANAPSAQVMETKKLSVTSILKNNEVTTSKAAQAIMERSVKKAETNKFGQTPDVSQLEPLGHGKIDTSVRWVNNDNKTVSITSPYGMLTVKPVSQTAVRVSFAAGGPAELSSVPREVLTEGNVRFKCIQGKTSIDIETEKIKVSVERRTGAVSFYSKASGLLLSENDRVTRQINSENKLCWEYFDFGKKETLKACSAGNEWFDITGAAGYVSPGNGDAAVIMSSKGYKIIVPGDKNVLLNDVQSYDTFLRMQGNSTIDYFFVSAR